MRICSILKAYILKVRDSLLLGVVLNLGIPAYATNTSCACMILQANSFFSVLVSNIIECKTQRSSCDCQGHSRSTGELSNDGQRRAGSGTGGWRGGAGETGDEGDLKGLANICWTALTV